MALTGDIKIVRYGVVDTHPPLTKGITAVATVYRGSISLTRSGYLIAASSPQSTDVCWGLNANGGPGVADTAPGVLGASPSGTTSMEIATGTFLLAMGTGSDAFTVGDEQATAFVIDEQTVGKTSGSATRPVAGRVIATPTSDPTIPTGFVAVTLGTNATFGAI